MYKGKHPRPRYFRPKKVRSLRKKRPRIRRPKRNRVPRGPRPAGFPLKTIVSTQHFSTFTDPFNGVTYPYVNTRSTQNLGDNSIMRVSDPNWKVKVAKHMDAVNPYSVVKHEGRPFRISGRAMIKVSGPSRYLDTTGFAVDCFVGTVAAWDDPSTQDLALKKLKKKLSDNIGMFNAVVPVVELREIRKGIISLIDSAHDVASRLGLKLNGRRLSPKTLRRAIAEAWLQWSFGIKPLLSDIRNANEAISTFLTSSDHRVRLQAGSSITRNVSLVNPSMVGLYGTSVTAFVQGTETLFYKYVGAFDLKVKSSNDYSAENVFGLEPSSILTTLYELTPYSWLIDYFTSLGDYLDDTFECPPGSLTYLSFTKTHIRSEHHTAKFVTGAGNFIIEENMQPGHRSYKAISRQKLTTLPRLSLRIKTLGEIEKNGLNKLANLLAVLKSAHGVPRIRGK